MFRQNFKYLIIFALLTACTQESENPGKSDSGYVPDFYYFSRLDSVEKPQSYIGVVENSVETGIDLKQNFDIQFANYYMNILDDNLYFHQRFHSVEIEKFNLTSKKKQTITDFCTSDRNPNYSTWNTENKYFSIEKIKNDDNTYNIYLLLKETNCDPIFIGSCNEFYDLNIPIATQDKILFYFEHQGITYLKQFAFNTLELLEFSNEKQFKTLVSSQNIYIVQGDEYRKLNRETFKVEEIKTTAASDYIYEFGLNDIKVKGSNFFTSLQYAQPSFLKTTPAIFDLESNQLVKGNYQFLYDLNENLKMRFEEPVSFVYTYDVSDDMNNILIPYFQQGAKNQNGIVITNFKGEILKTLKINELPYYIHFKD